MKRRTLIAVVAILALAVTPVFGSGEEEASATGPPTMQIYANYWDRNPNWSPETLVLAKFAEIAGADIELVTGDAQKLKTLVASGDLPDTMWGGFTRLEAMDFGTKGALYPIDTLSDMMPNLATWREKYPEYDAAMTAPDGKKFRSNK
jgi:ABC-type glycerol-3-phosphate transport system substrate-binding protein